MSRDSARPHHSGTERIGAIDPLRGLAMVLVIAQHAYHFVDPAAAGALANQLVYGITGTAPVAFVALSGTTLGYFVHSAQAGLGARSPREVAARFRRRALFLLVFAHPAIHLARLYNLNQPALGVAGQLVERLLFEFPITDTIAVCLLIAPWPMRRCSTAARAALAAALLVVTLVVLAAWEPQHALGAMIRAVLFGAPERTALVRVGWPLVPWLGIFLLGGLAGELLARARGGELTLHDVVRRLLRAAAALGVLGVVLSAGYKLVRMQLTGALDERIFRLLYPDRTTGLLPLDLAALALLLAALLWRIDLHGRGSVGLWALSVLGRTSLFTYVVQFMFVHSLPAAFGLRHRLGYAGVALLAVASLAATGLLAYAYGRARGWIAADDYRRQREQRVRSPLAHDDPASPPAIS